MIDPLAMNLPAGLDRYRAYWWATALRASYTQFSNIPGRLHELVDAAYTEVGLTPGGVAVPRSDAWHYPTIQAGVIVIRGTDSPQQLVTQIVGGVLAPIGPWPGQVSPFFANAAFNIAAAVATWRTTHPMNTWGICGHSMGGAVSALLRGLPWVPPPPLFIVDAGSPRSGSLAYAAAQVGQRLRLTNTGDPVPMVPPSSTPGVTLANPFVPLVPSPTQARHWGTRHHLWRDGSSSMPLESTADVEVAEYLAVVGARNNWVGDHQPGEYARRLRMGIPVRWPAGLPVAEFPSLEVMDQLNKELNDLDGIAWIPTESATPWPAGPGIFELPTCAG